VRQRLHEKSRTAAKARRTKIREDASDDYMRRCEYDQAVTSYKEALAFSPDDEQLRQRIECTRRAKTTEAKTLLPSSP
jgi:hypothetical protein